MSVEDRLAIQDLKHEYCYAIDSGEYEHWASLFTEDGRFVRDDGSTFEGRDELYSFGNEMFDAAFAAAAHLVMNPRIEVTGETATGTWYLMLVLESTDGEFGWRQARYDDRYRKVDGEWKIEEANVTYRIQNNP